MTEKRVEPAESSTGIGAVPPAARAGVSASTSASAGDRPADPKRLGPLVENVTQSATACLITMVQGNVFAMTLTHWAIASRTGLVSGTIATAALWVAGSKRRSTVAALLALVTFGVDYFSHPSHFGSAVTEAIVTGLAAGSLSLVVGKVLQIRASTPSKHPATPSATSPHRR